MQTRLLQHAALAAAIALSLQTFALQPAAAPAAPPQVQEAIYAENAIEHPVWAKNGMVASQEALASAIGRDILQQGGNAVDAAVAVGFALAVTLPRAGNIGGGGFMLIHDAKKNETIAIDYREKAPKAAFRDMYLDENGNADEERSRYHGLAVGVPGTVDGLLLALAEHGTMTREQVLAPAIRLAEEGFTVTPGLSNSLQGLAERMTKWPSTAKIFYHADGRALQPGETLKQPSLEWKRRGRRGR